jgi:hypothetical protein
MEFHSIPELPWNSQILSISPFHRNCEMKSSLKYSKGALETSKYSIGTVKKVRDSTVTPKKVFGAQRVSTRTDRTEQYEEYHKKHALHRLISQLRWKKFIAHLNFFRSCNGKSPHFAVTVECSSISSCRFFGIYMSKYPVSSIELISMPKVRILRRVRDKTLRTGLIS